MKRWACIARMGGIGDNLIAASVLRPLKRMGYMTEVLTSGHAHTVFLNNPFLDKLSVKEDGDIPGGPEWQKWFTARAKEYDIFAHLSHSMEVRHAFFPDSTIFWCRPEYRRKVAAGNYLETVHDIVGVAHDFGPMFFPTDEEKDRAENSKRVTVGGQPYIAWVISGSRLDKIYPASTMLIPRIIKEIGMPVVMVGTGGKQFEMAKSIETAVRHTNSELKGLHLALSPDASDPGGHQHWSTRRSIAQTMAADLVITPDTGIAWAVAMEPMPKVVLLSHASAENITKHWVNTTTLHADPNNVPCWPCHRLHSDMTTCTPNKDTPNAAACISDISVEQILSSIRAALGTKKVVNLRAA